MSEHRFFQTNFAQNATQKGTVYCAKPRGSAEVFKPFCNKVMRKIRKKKIAGVGFEPTISRLWALRDTGLLYPAKLL